MINKIKQNASYYFLVICCLLSVATLCSARDVILWISIDGVRPDYIVRSNTPTFDKIMKEGAFSLQMVPVFPSLTFVNHVSQATGVCADEHGIVSNSFFDRELQQNFRYPSQASLLLSEPIWLTAERQQIRTAVLDWPLSQSQKGDITTSYFGTRFDSGLTDEQRVQGLMRIWEDDNHEQPLQLLMGWIGAPDRTGHRYGPDSAEIENTMAEVDTLISQFLKQALEIFHSNYDSNSSFYLVLTSDHGMSATHTLVNPEKLAGVQDEDSIKIVTSANLGNLYIQGDLNERRKKELLNRLQTFEFVDVYTWDTFPDHLRYLNIQRTGDIILVLNDGHTFSRKPDGITGCAIEHGGPLGMHGYGVDNVSEMMTVAFIWRYPDLLGGVDLKKINSLQLHPTIAQMLSIEPAKNAVASPLKLETNSEVSCSSN